MDAHVVRHEIENEPHIRTGESSGKASKCLLAGEFGIERIMVDDVVAVRAARSCLQEGRSIKVADAECLEVRPERGGVVEAELGRELDTIGCERDGGRHL